MTMSTPLWVLLAFACWTLIVLMIGVGIRRWTLILTGQAQIADFPGDVAHGSTPYRRAVRAHANCVENLPVYGAIATTAFAVHVASPTIDTLALVFIGARVSQTIVHMAFVETNTAVFIRFTFFFVQVVAMFWMALEVAHFAT
jgi:uncharacterized MAPEG superfamily protein